MEIPGELEDDPGELEDDCYPTTPGVISETGSRKRISSRQVESPISGALIEEDTGKEPNLLHEVHVVVRPYAASEAPGMPWTQV